LVQRSLFSLAQTSPQELYRSTISKSEIQHRALVTVPQEMLETIPQGTSTYSLFQGFQATLPDDESSPTKRHHRRGRKLLKDGEEGPLAMVDLKNERRALAHKLEMHGIRKNMCSSEIREIDNKIANLNAMREIVLDRLATLEQEEMSIEEDIAGLDNKIDDLQEDLNDAGAQTPPSTAHDGQEGGGFMSESIYEKLPTPTRRRKPRRISMPILHEHLQPGSKLKEIQAHSDAITALDFDAPFGTLVSAALDDTVCVWDLNAGRCIGQLEGHLSSVRCLQVDDEIVATGSTDASIRLWDLSKAHYVAHPDGFVNKTSSATDGSADDDLDDGLDFQNAEDGVPPPPPGSMRDCPLFSLEAHVAEVTALHFRGNTLVSGSADKTLRQWDLEKGRCVQTLDVLWAAAQADVGGGSAAPAAAGAAAGGGAAAAGQWLPAGGRPPPPDAATAGFVGALQVFDAALACGTADGLVRLWDLRSGQVHRSLVGHTGPVTALQFDDVHLVTASLDRSIRVSLPSDEEGV
jgi:division protein 1